MFIIFQISRTEKAGPSKTLTNAFDINANYISGCQASSIMEGTPIEFLKLCTLHQTNKASVYAICVYTAGVKLTQLHHDILNCRYSWLPYYPSQKDIASPSYTWT